MFYSGEFQKKWTFVAQLLGLLIFSKSIQFDHRGFLDDGRECNYSQANAYGAYGYCQMPSKPSLQLFAVVEGSTQLETPSEFLMNSETAAQNIGGVQFFRHSDYSQLKQFAQKTRPDELSFSQRGTFWNCV